jgi:hypothetical protein
MLTNLDSNSTTKTLNIEHPVISLSCVIPPHKDKMAFEECKGKEEIGSDNSSDTKQHLKDIACLKPMELHNKYPRTYKCWDNMKQRKKKGAIIHLEFDKFKDFLRHVGPCEKANYTLDRINNEDPEYAPGKVEWRDKFSQNSNKGNNIYLTHDDGRKHTIAQWAKITKQNASTLYKRHEKGWSSMEIITGTKHEQKPQCDNHPWPCGEAEELESSYIEAILEHGYVKPRINFLYEYSSERILHFKDEVERIELAICKDVGFDDDYSEDYFKSYLNENQISLDKYNNNDISDLMSLLNISTRNLRKWKDINSQSGNAIKYEELLEKFMKKSHILPKEKILDYIHSFFPKPEYTLNSHEDKIMII